MAGYYGEGKGAGEDAGGNQAHWDWEARREGRAMEELARLVGDIEAGIEEAGAALRISQPPMHGKYDVRWWMTSALSMLAQVCHQPFKARVSLKLRRGCPYRVKAGAEVAGRPLGLVSYHQAEEVQCLFRKFAAETCLV